MVYALLQPAARLAVKLGLPTRELAEWLEIATFHETRQAGFKMRESTELLGLSMRKLARLSKLLKHNFMRTEEEHALPRRIEFMLWAQPVSAARLAQAMPDVEPKRIDEALAQLEREGRVLRRGSRTTTYQASKPQRRLVRDDWIARVDALGDLLSTSVNAVYGRFFSGEPNAFARTLTLRVRREDLPELRRMYEEAIWKTLVEIDARAEDHPDAQAVTVSVVWAPYEHLRLSRMDAQPATPDESTAGESPQGPRRDP